MMHTSVRLQMLLSAQNNVYDLWLASSSASLTW